MANVGIDGLGELPLARWSCRAGDADIMGAFAGTAARQARRPLHPHDAAADGALSSMTS